MSNHIAFIFPGQGSQTVGMLSDIASEFSEVETTFSEASAVLGYDLWQLVHSGPAEVLDKTVYTQPALLTASYAIWRIIQAKTPIVPSVLAGHSLGEYSALVCANAISFTDAVRLVAARGQFMQEAIPTHQEGALAAIIGLDDATVAAICDQAKEGEEVLSPANFNSPGQVVIAGHKPAVERALILAKAAGSRLAKLLPVSVPSHCSLMKPAAERLATLLSNITIQKPQFPVINNVDVKVYENAEAIRDGLIRQLYMPVRWVETIEQLANLGITQLIECGPGKVLNGLNKRINSSLQLTNTADLASLRDLLANPLAA